MSVSFIVKGSEDNGATVKLFMRVSSGQPCEILRNIVLFDDDLDESEEFCRGQNGEQRVWAHIVAKLLSIPEDPEALVAWYAAVEFASSVMRNRFMPRQILEDARGGKSAVLTERSIRKKVAVEMDDRGGFSMLSGPGIACYLIGQRHKNVSGLDPVRERIIAKTIDYLGRELEFPPGITGTVRGAIDQMDIPFLDEQEKWIAGNPNYFWHAWCKYFRTLDDSDLSLFCPSRPFTTQKAYLKIRAWYQSHKEQALRLGPREDNYVERSMGLIDALPHLNSLTSLEIRAVFREVIVGLLEWAFRDSDGDYTMGQYAKLALEGEGMTFHLSKAELKQLSRSWIWRHVKPKVSSKVLNHRNDKSSKPKSPVFRASEANWRILSTLTKNCSNSRIGMSAVECLAEHWRDERTRDLLISLAQGHANCLAGSRAVEALALFWRDDATRKQLISFVENSEDTDGKSTAVMSLMSYQRDEKVREILTSLVKSDPNSLSGCTAVEVLAAYWRDETTRQLITALVQNQPHSRAASQAVASLARNWHDDVTRQLLVSLVQTDANSAGGHAAIATLAEDWRDEVTHQLLASLVKKGAETGAEGSAVESLAKHWRNEETLSLLTSLVEKGDDSWEASSAVESLAEYWDDDVTRQLMTSLIVNSADTRMAMTAVRCLANQWCNDRTRQLLVSLVQDNPDSWSANPAVDYLALHWHDESTRAILISLTKNSVDTRAGTRAVDRLVGY